MTIHRQTTCCQHKTCDIWHRSGPAFGAWMSLKIPRVHALDMTTLRASIASIKRKDDTGSPFLNPLPIENLFVSELLNNTKVCEDCRQPRIH